MATTVNQSFSFKDDSDDNAAIVDDYVLYQAPSRCDNLLCRSQTRSKTQLASTN